MELDGVAQSVICTASWAGLYKMKLSNRIARIGPNGGVTNHFDQRFLGINMMRWHTWGVIWTPSSVTYTVDGQVWGSVTVPSEIPNIPMTLDMEQRTKCSFGTQCPTRPISMQVDWVAEYTPTP